MLGVAFAYQASPGTVPPAARRTSSLHMSASSSIGAIPQSQISKTAAARRALFGSCGGQCHHTLSTSLNAAASAAAIYHSPDESDDAETKPFNPGPYYEFGSSGLKLNWFGAIYGTVAITLGIIWYASLCACQLMYLITRGKVDKYRRVPIAFSQIWATTLMNLMGCTPKVTGMENIKKVFKENGGPVMFVANHCSWMDIPFVGVNVGWRNYKIIAKEELLKVPILSKSLTTAGHVMLDRSSRRSQFNAYKKGVQYLKDGVNLVTFPEGTRSRDGRLGSFKKGAFKMAEAVNAPIVPMTIGYAHKVQPLDFIFPVRRSRSIPATIHFGEAIDTSGKKDEEVMEAVWNGIAADLPESQKPLEGTPKAVN